MLEFLLHDLYIWYLKPRSMQHLAWGALRSRGLRNHASS
jgi:hypothetical protein